MRCPPKARGGARALAAGPAPAAGVSPRAGALADGALKGALLTRCQAGLPWCWR